MLSIFQSEVASEVNNLEVSMVNIWKDLDSYSGKNYVVKEVSNVFQII